MEISFFLPQIGSNAANILHFLQAQHFKKENSGKIFFLKLHFPKSNLVQQLFLWI